MKKIKIIYEVEIPYRDYLDLMEDYPEEIIDGNLTKNISFLNECLGAKLYLHEELKVKSAEIIGKD